MELKKSVNDDYFRYSAFLEPEGWREMFARLLAREPARDKRKIIKGIDF